MFFRFCAQIGKLRSNLATDLILNRRRQADAAGLGNALQPPPHVDAVAEDVMGADDHVADIDPDPEQDALIRRIVARVGP